MGKWLVYKMEDLIDEISMGPFGSDIKVSCFVDDGIPVLNGSNLSGIRLTEDSFRFVTEEKADALKKANAVRGNVVVTHRGTLGQIAYIPQNSRYPRYVISQSQFRFCCNERVLPEYVVNYFHTRIGQNKILAYASQVGVPAIARATSSFREIEIPVPPIPTQKKIAAVLSALDDKIENNRRICKTLEEMAQAIFKSWFVDFEPWGGVMPEGWRRGKLGDVAECNPFRKLGKGVDAKCVEMSDLTVDGPFPSGWSTRRYNGGMKFRNGDTVIARITPCFENGKVGFVNFLEDDEVAFGSTEYVVISSHGMIPAEWFYCLARDPNFISYAKSRMNGSSGRQRFSASDVAEYEIPIAPDEMYKKVAPLLASVMMKIKNCGFESRALASMRDALLPKLMSGEIDVDKVVV